MIYKILNKRLEKKIDTLLPKVGNVLHKDIDEQNILLDRLKRGEKIASMFADKERIKEAKQTINQRLDVFSDYKILHTHLKNDQKRRYMINSNFYKFLKALEYLYKTSNLSVQTGQLTAPNEVYFAVNAVMKSFFELIEEYKLK